MSNINSFALAGLSYGELQQIRYQAEEQIKATTCMCKNCQWHKTFLLKLVAETTRIIVLKEDIFLALTSIELVLYACHVPFYKDSKGDTIILAA